VVKDRDGSTINKPKMVGWYNPFQLARTGYQAAISLILAERADYRVIQALGEEPEDAADHSRSDEIWIDYVADLGDGWEPTYTVASLLVKNTLSVKDDKQKPHVIRRGNILVMGGDEVYPAASRKEYKRRLREPYKSARTLAPTPRPFLYVLPGNHDWYDGLISFTRLFCQRRMIGMWQTRQTRSYFAVNLPHRWWLLGVDTQLKDYIDGPQLGYFRKVANQMRKGDRVILCTPEPDWIYGKIYDPELRNNVAFLERELIRKSGAKVMLWLAGDFHHYRRHEAEDGPGVQKITSGGGGAFLHPTHGESVKTLKSGPTGQDTYKLRKAYPDLKTSRCLTYRNLMFPLINPRFGLLTGLFYTILAWVIPHKLAEIPLVLENVGMALGSLAGSLAVSPSGLFWVLVVIAAFVLFTDTHKKTYRGIAGIVHGVAHLLFALVIAWAAARFSVSYLGLQIGSVTSLITTGIGTFVGGYIAGSLLMGWYLLISLNRFNRHANEAFSALRCPDYKNFLRLHIDQSGDLTVYPIGIDQTPRKWVKNLDVNCPECKKVHRSNSESESACPRFIPAGNGKIHYRLIEDPILIRGRAK
jgi:hypothetical protein